MSDPAEPRAPGWLEVAVPLLLLVIPGAFAMQVLLGLGAVPEGPLDSPQWIELQMILQGLNCLLVVTWMLGARRSLRFGSPQVTRTLGTFVLFMVIWIPVAMKVYPWVLERLSEPLQQQAQLIYFSDVDFVRPGLWYCLVVAVLLGPLAEELVFRGYLYGAAKQALGAGKALLLTSALFGLIHGVQYAVPIALLGLLFGWLRERSGGLAAPILAHVLHNSIVVAVVIWFPSFFEELSR